MKKVVSRGRIEVIWGRGGVVPGLKLAYADIRVAGLVEGADEWTRFASGGLGTGGFGPGDS